MKVALVAITKNGSELAMKTGTGLHKNINTEVAVYIKENYIAANSLNDLRISPLNGALYDLVKEIFVRFDAIVFIMACGIAVRTIAPLIRSKTTDPAVLVIDEKGKFVISLLSGHIGGGNRLASEIAALIGAVPVITTATDINGVLSFDEFAVKNKLVIENIKNLKYISSELVNGNRVGFFSDCTIRGTIPPEVIFAEDICSEAIKDLRAIVVLSNRTDIYAKESTVLYLRPKNLVIGFGCKRGTNKERIREAVENALFLKRKSIRSVKCIATIDLKADEEGLLEFCKETEIKLEIIPKDDIEKKEKQFQGSKFVKDKVGVSCVAEPCAYLAAMKGRFVLGKTAFEGITIAIFEEDTEITI